MGSHVLRCFGKIVRLRAEKNMGVGDLAYVLDPGKGPEKRGGGDMGAEKARPYDSPVTEGRCILLSGNDINGLPGFGDEAGKPQTDSSRPVYQATHVLLTPLPQHAGNIQNGFLSYQIHVDKV